MIQRHLSLSKRPSFVAEASEPLDALCMNRERTYVAVAGRTVTKVYSVGDDRFELRVERNKPRTAMYFSGSIAWSPLKDNLVAAASSSGYIFLWDPESAHSAERSYKAHKQLVTKVCFSEFNEHLLVSGSKDSSVWLYDLRVPEPSTCFAYSAALDWSNRDDSIRDIQFCMDSKMQDSFVTAGDSGTIRFWDARRPDKPFKEFFAHSSQVYSIALNPQLHARSLLATAGRDKYIRIWDWTKNTPRTPLYTVEMMAIVTRVSWCPDNSWHVACCFAPPSGFISSDNTIYVWDIRRPYIPFASFDAHTKTCTDMSWPRYGSGDRFLSCGKDGKLIMNFVESAHRPLLYANTVALDARSPSDGCVVAVPADRRKSSAINDPFRRKVPSTVFCTQPSDPSLMSARTIAYYAENYKLVGGSVEELCEHNARVAERIFRSRLAYTWRMIALLCAQTDLGAVRPRFAQSATTQAFKRSLSSTLLEKKERHHNSNRVLHGGGGTKPGGESPADVSSTAARNQQKPSQDGHRQRSAQPVLISGSLSAAAFSSTGGALLDDLFFGADELNFDGMVDALYGDGALGVGDEARTTMRSSKRSIVCSSVVDLSQLKEEAFDIQPYNGGGRSHTAAGSGSRRGAAKGTSAGGTPLRRHIHAHIRRQQHKQQQRAAPRIEAAVNAGRLNSTRAFESSRRRSQIAEVEEEEDVGDEGVLSNSDESCVSSSVSEEEESGSEDETNGEEEEGGESLGEEPVSGSDEPEESQPTSGGRQSATANPMQFDPLPSLKSVLEHHSELGDVQMCACVCMVVGERIVESRLVSAQQAEIWFLNYLELLERLRLWRVSAVLLKSCFRVKISQLSNESTFFKVWCPGCRSTAPRASPRCKSCRRLYNYQCVICETPVRGLWSCCAECGHGGHTAHMEDWFARWEQCPAPGCAHRCAVGAAKREEEAQQRRMPHSPMVNIC